MVRLLIVQPLAIRRGQRELHRRLGRASVILAVAVVVTAVLLAHARFAAMDEVRFRAEAYNLYLPIAAALLFAVSYGLGFAYRSVTPLHARLMACTAVVLIDPVMARILGLYFPPLEPSYLHEVISYGLTDVALLVLLLTYRGAGFGRGVLASVVGVFMLAQLLWFQLAPAPLWFAFADWFRRLPLT